MALIPVAIGAVSGMMQGQANKEQANSQAAALRQNALYMGNAANDARARGIQEADWSRVQGQGLIGTQRAAMAASGGVVDTGSNAILQQDVAQLAELDALTISNNAAREAYGYDVSRADNLTTARNLQTNARKGMMTSILGGALGGAGSSIGGMFGGGGASTGAAKESVGVLNSPSIGTIETGSGGWRYPGESKWRTTPVQGATITGGPVRR
jgi:hypothetical protein